MGSEMCIRDSSIAERSGVIQEKIKAVREDEQIKGKEKTDHVQFR